MKSTGRRGKKYGESYCNVFEISGLSSVNGGPPLDFQFDLGAGGSILKKASVPKARMTFDGTITLRNSDGENVVPSSSSNQVEIGELRWTGVPFAIADNMTHREDGLIGNALFQDKVVEIDYDRMVIAVHDALPRVLPTPSETLNGRWHVSSFSPSRPWVHS
jgi:hypothetical protein